MEYFHRLRNNFEHSPENFFLFALGLIFMAIWAVNFPWGKSLLGWDNLLPELHFPINLERGIFSLWQENEGLGAISGHGFAATILHTLFLWVLSLFISMNYLRPFFMFFMLLFGSFGTFSLVYDLLLHRYGRIGASKGAFISGFYYMVNFATVGMFYIPLEAFAVHFAFLPWLLLSALKVLREGRRKHIFYFSLFTFLSSMQGFIPPLFILYFVFLSLLCIWMVLKQRKREIVKRSIGAILLTFLLNAYWLLPVGYYSIFKSRVYLNSYNNLMTTNDFIAKTNKFGTVDNLILLKGFIYDAVDGLGGQDLFYIFQPWRDHFQHQAVIVLSTVIFLLIIGGVLYALWKASYKLKIFAIFFFFSFTLLATDVYPLSIFSDILRNHMPLFRQAFRIAFTKVSISLALFYSLFLAYGVMTMMEYLRHKNTRLRQLIAQSLFVGITTGLIYIYFPIFNGNLFYSRIKTTLPDDYTQVFEFFQKQPIDGRIANFPQVVPTGWSIYRWGYSGSGFLWYGLKQPILDRNFDVWSNYNENYFWELSYAVYSNNSELLDKLFKKYDIRWIIVDRSSAGFVSPKSLYLEKVNAMLGSLSNVVKSKEFGELTIFQVQSQNAGENFISIEDNIPEVGPKYEWSNFDQAYVDYDDYFSYTDQSEITSSYSSYYPFRTLFTGRNQAELPAKISENSDSFIFQTSIPKTVLGGRLKTPALFENETGEVDENDLSKRVKKYPELYLDGEILPLQVGQNNRVNDITGIDLKYIQSGQLQAVVPKIYGYYSYDSEKNGDLFKKEPKNCNQIQTGLISSEVIGEGDEKFLRLDSLDASGCIDFELPTLSHKNGYLVKVESRNIEGTPLLLSIMNRSSLRSDSEMYLPQAQNIFTSSYSIIPPMEEFGVGYTVRLSNNSIGKRTINDIARIRVYPIPLRFLTSLSITNPNLHDRNQRISKNIENSTMSRLNSSQYEIVMKNLYQYDNPMIILSQGFDPGWKAFAVSCVSENMWCRVRKLFPFVFGNELTQHVIVNSWKNGWRLESTTHNPQPFDSAQGKPTTIVIVYLPQYLEYFGFGLLGVSTLSLLLTKQKKIFV